MNLRLPVKPDNELPSWLIPYTDEHKSVLNISTLDNRPTIYVVNTRLKIIGQLHFYRTNEGLYPDWNVLYDKHTVFDLVRTNYKTDATGNFQDVVHAHVMDAVNDPDEHAFVSHEDLVTTYTYLTGKFL